MTTSLRLSALFLAIALAAGCSTSDDPPYYGPIVPEEGDSGGVGGAKPAQGFIGDGATKRFHRRDCPLVDGIPESRREWFDVPFDALNADYHPCDECDPLRGWK